LLAQPEKLSNKTILITRNQRCIALPTNDRCHDIKQVTDIHFAKIWPEGQKPENTLPQCKFHKCLQIGGLQQT
jgi:hypothetical protein